MGIPGFTEALDQSVLAPRPGSGRSSMGELRPGWTSQGPSGCRAAFVGKRGSRFIILSFIPRLTMVRRNSDSGCWSWGLGG